MELRGASRSHAGPDEGVQLRGVLRTRAGPTEGVELGDASNSRARAGEGVQLLAEAGGADPARVGYWDFYRVLVIVL